MIINRIEKLKNNKYKIYLESETIITYDDVIINNNLLYKKNIDNNLYKKIITDTCYYDIYNKTVKYILKSRKSEKQIVDYIKKIGANDEDCNSIVKKLKEVNLINDIEYCRAFINDSIYLSKKGINKIKIELLENNIPIEVIDQEFSNIDEDIIDNKLEKMIVKKIKYNKKYSEYELKQRILNEMINMGYSKNKILEIVEKNIGLNNNVVEREFDKIYNKFMIKYDGMNLYNKVKQKMLSKGFKLDEINRLLDEKKSC